MLKQYLQQLLSAPHLSQKNAEAALDIILDEADPHQVAAFLAILKYRGETPEEIVGMVNAIEKRAVPISLPIPVLDIVGTGGDLANTVNISTGSAILAAACGVPIAKIGNRSFSSRCGSVDVLEALGIAVEIPPSQLYQHLKEVNLAFMFAPYYHPCLKKVSSVRKGLRIPTVFNILGPLLNPAKAEYGLIGVPNDAVLKLMTEVIKLQNRRKRVLIFHGNGLDELSPLGLIHAYDIQDGKATPLEIDPSSLGFPSRSLHELQGGDAETNASLLREAFAKGKGAIADVLILNAGAALWIFGSKPDLLTGVEMARDVLESGAALKLLDKWKSLSNFSTHPKTGK